MASLLVACAEPSAQQLAECARPPSREALASGDGAPSTAGEVAAGAALFEEHCARCHSRHVADRGSRFFRGYPRLDCAPYLASVDDAYLERVIREGGPAVGRDAAMTPFGEVLDARQRADLIAWLRAQPGL